MKRTVRDENKSKHLALREFLQQYRVTPNCTTGRTPAEPMLGHQPRSFLSVLQPCAHKAKLKQKSTLPAKPKFSTGAYVHYRDFIRNHPKWVAGKVTGHVGKKMFIAVVQQPDGHCRRHQYQLKVRSVLLRSTMNVIHRRISIDMPTVFPNLMFTSQARPRTKNCPFSLINMCYLVVRFP